MDQMVQRHVTKTVREFLFDGYEDPLITMAETLPALAQIDIPFDKFGWFYKVHYNLAKSFKNVNFFGRVRE